MSQSFTPFETLENAFRSWWLIVVLMMLGGLVGFALNRIRPPLYEAISVIAVSIDFSRSGDLEDYEEDYVIGIAGDVIQSSEVVAHVADLAGISQDQLNSQLYLERSYYTWTLRARDASSQRAAELANLWADQAVQELGASLEQALLADRYANQLDQLEDCMAHPEPAPVLCSDLSQVRLQIEEISTLQRDAIVQSRGVPSYTLFTLSQRAAVPTRPAVFNQGQMVLAGALIGLLLALWAIHLRLPDRLRERLSRA